jgi:hypothetical protein
LNVTQSQLSELQIGINQTILRREDLIGIAVAGTYVSIIIGDDHVDSAYTVESILSGQHGTRGYISTFKITRVTLNFV